MLAAFAAVSTTISGGAAQPSKPRIPVAPGGDTVTREMFARCIGCDAHGMNFRNRDLHETRIVGADLHDADLSGADLHGSTITGGDLRRAKFDGADLRQARLIGVAIDGASFAEAKMDGARITGAHVRVAGGMLGMGRNSEFCMGCDLHDPAVRRRVTPTATPAAAAVTTDFHNAKLPGASITGSAFRNANFSGADLSGSRLTGLSLENANLSGASLRNATICSSSSGVHVAYRVRSTRSGDGASPAPTAVPAPSPSPSEQRRISCVNLRGANLRSADLRGAQVCDGPTMMMEHLEMLAPHAMMMDGTMPRIFIPRNASPDRMPVHVETMKVDDMNQHVRTVVERATREATQVAPETRGTEPPRKCRPVTASELRTNAGATLEGANFDGPA